MEDDNDPRAAAAQNNNNNQETMSIVSHDSDDESCGSSIPDVEYLQAATQKISLELNKHSFDYRNHLTEVVHGVATQTREETEFLLQSSLTQLTRELEQLVLYDWKNNNTTNALSAGYLLSRRGSTPDAYINQNSFRLRFLRAENFDAKKAAVRLMRFMNFVLGTFGAFALFRPIQLSDFKRSELKALQSGWLQLLPFRDRSGRKVLVFADKLGFQYDAVLWAKILAYMFLVTTRDVETQQKGIVTVHVPEGIFKMSKTPSPLNTRSKQLRFLSYINGAYMSLPFKVCAHHLCLMHKGQRRFSTFERLTLKLVTGMVGECTHRLKIHMEEGIELRNVLSGYGILMDLFPTTDSGTMKTVEFKKWLKFQRQVEEHEGPQDEYVFQHLDIPGFNDVVFRMGSAMICNPGNVKFRGLIERHIQENMITDENYHHAQGWNPKTKDEVAIEIMEEISKRRMGRFLYWDNEKHCWIEFDDISQVRSRVAIAYRDLKLKIERAMQNS